MILRAAICFLSGAITVPACAAAPDVLTQRWIGEVLLGSEFGRPRTKIIRWAQPNLRVSVFGAGPDQKTAVVIALADLGATLSTEGVRLSLVRDRDAAADIEVHFARKDDIPAVARQHRIQAPKDDLGFFWSFWDNRHVITKAYIFLAADRLAGRGLRHFVLEELAQSLGLPGDSAVFIDSIFYQKDKDGGGAQRLSALDRCLIRWLYRRAVPGDDAAAIARKLAATW